MQHARPLNNHVSSEQNCCYIQKRHLTKWMMHKSIAYNCEYAKLNCNNIASCFITSTCKVVNRLGKLKLRST